MTLQSRVFDAPLEVQSHGLDMGDGVGGEAAAKRTKSSFLAAMSHDIRTPMNGVLGMMDVLEQQALDAAQRRTVAIMRESAQALLRVIDDRLAQLTDGEVTLESASGMGLRFTVTLALDAVPADSRLKVLPPPAVQTARSAASAGMPRVLVVDDHPINREVLVRQLDLLGIAADTARDGAEALSLWAPGRYSAVLSDILMPNMDGHELTRKVRAAEASRGVASRTPMVAVTALGVPGEEQRCLAAGMDGCLVKPVSIEQLRETLGRWLAIRAGAHDPAGPDDEPEGAADPIDHSALAAWFGDDRSAIVAVLRTFRTSAIETEREIERAARAGYLAGVAAAAHRLKGAARAVGAERVALAAEVVEQAGRAGDRAPCNAGLGRLAVELRRVITDIERTT
ncbi:MAG TPA: response regulator [Xanthobacteraceae bacterium]|nr:response regulator [Xanthobacteraceae bacterium]